MAKRVVIAGGGLAGLTCAKYLVDEGFSVTLLEGLPYLGGRASTYRDADGDWVEQGLHLFLGVYSEFKALLRGIGRDPDDPLFWMQELRLQDPEGAQATFVINPLRSPVRTAVSILGQNDYLGPLDKLSLLPLVAPGVLPLEYLRTQHDGETVVDWWERVNGDVTVLERFIRPFCRGIQFSEPEQYSAYNFLGLIHHVAYDLPHALLGGYRGARDEIIFQPLARYLQERGATLRTQVKLREILYSPGTGGGAGKVDGFILEGGERLQADHYVVAIPVWELVVLKHRKHLVRPLPGAMSRRPAQATPIPNLFLAGDWTQQPFFGSQEGAVRGGKACAEAVLQSVSAERG